MQIQIYVTTENALFPNFFFFKKEWHTQFKNQTVLKGFLMKNAVHSTLSSSFVPAYPSEADLLTL